MSSVAKWMKGLRYPSDEGDEDLIRNWGFTIYRTGYAPSSDQQWQDLLETIQTHAYKHALRMTGATEEDSAFQQVWSLFRMDARSDTSLAGLDMDQLRLQYNDGDGGPCMNTDYRSHRVFLVADEKVLSDVTASTIKCVDADYQAADHISRNWRVGRQRYFGWMPMQASCVAQLWVELELFTLETIAPATIGGSHLEVWDASSL